MCFRNLTQRKAKVAEEDIECYKFLQETAGELVSPFYGVVPWVEKEIAVPIKFDEEVTEDFVDLIHGFHSCKTLQNCIAYRQNEEHSTVCAIYKFIIPKGSLYYENLKQYLSNKIYLVSKEPVEDKVAYDIEIEF